MVLDEHIFNEDVYSSMKSVAKFKFLHIGLLLEQSMLNLVSTWEDKSNFKEQALEYIITPNFLGILVKNVQN